MRRLENRTAIVTGATSGIGRDCRPLSQAGASVAVDGRRESLDRRIVDDIRTARGNAVYVHADVTSEANVSRMVDQVMASFGRIDVLFNNAGGSTPADGTVIDAPVEEFWRAISLDLLGTWLCCKYAIPHMLNGRGGSVISMGSIVEVVGFRDKAAYTASKGGVMALTRAMAMDFANRGIRVNTVVPGIVASERVQTFIDGNPQLVENYRLGIPRASYIAQAVTFLASDESKKINGHMLPVDGGLLIS